MGFKVNRRTYDLSFAEESVLHGAVIKVHAMTIGLLDEITQSETVVEWVNFLVEHIVEWNLEDSDGNALEITKDVINNALEPAEIVHIINCWVGAAKGVADPLEKPSSNGKQSQEE